MADECGGCGTVHPRLCVCGHAESYHGRPADAALFGGDDASSRTEPITMCLAWGCRCNRYSEEP